MNEKQKTSDGWFLHVAVGIGVVIAGLVLNVNENNRVDTVLGPNRFLPEICVTKRYFGINCPACGLTRSVISILHGKWTNACKFHPLGPVVFLGIILQIPYGLQLRFAKKPWSPTRNTARLLWGALLALLLVTWVV